MLKISSPSPEIAQLTTAFETIDAHIAADLENPRQKSLAEMLADMRTQIGGSLAPELDAETQRQFQQWSDQIARLGGTWIPLERLLLTLRVSRAAAAGSAPMSVPPKDLAMSACLAVHEIWNRFLNHSICEKGDGKNENQATALAQLIEIILPCLPDNAYRQSMLEKATMLKRIAQGEAISVVFEDTLEARAQDPAPALADG